jgi:hypothetical protein
MTNAKKRSCLLNCMTAGPSCFRPFILLLFFQCFVLTVGGDQHDGNEQSIFRIAGTAQASEAVPPNILLIVAPETFILVFLKRASG